MLEQQAKHTGMQDLRGRVAVITGGSTGIGLGIARALAREGVKLVVAGMNAQKAERAARQLQAGGAEALSARCDVTRRSEIEALADLAYSAYGKVDILINNAGVGNVGPLHTLEESEWDWVIDVNLKGVYLCSAVFLTHFLARGDRALIVNTGSETCFGLPGTALGSMFPYVAAKHGMLGLSEMISRDYAGQGISVSVLCPGPVATEIWNAQRSRQPEYGDSEAVDPKLGEILHQLGMDPDEVGEMTVEGIKNGDYYIITHANIRQLIEKRYRGAIAAMDKTDAWHRKHDQNQAQ